MGQESSHFWLRNSFNDCVLYLLQLARQQSQSDENDFRTRRCLVLETIYHVWQQPPIAS